MQTIYLGCTFDIFGLPYILDGLPFADEKNNLYPGELLQMIDLSSTGFLKCRPGLCQHRRGHVWNGALDEVLP
jgi:hypothetical protein